MGLIRLEGVRFGYGRAPVLDGLDLEVAEGAVTVLVGPSGSGKSTVLRLIAGFDAPARGAVLIDGAEASRDGRVLLPPESRGVGMVFQDLALWPHMTARRTLEFVLERALPPAERRQRVEETLAAVGLERHAGARPAALSGGERQRVALARAIVGRPRILLMDEPLSNLDPPLRLVLVAEIRRLQRQLGLTALYVTHSREEVFLLGDRAAVMRAGRTEQAGTPRELYERPASAFVATFLGPCALLPASVRDGRLESPLGPLPLAGPPPADGAAQAVVRPEDAVIEAGGPFAGRVERVTSLGGGVEIEIVGPGWRLLASTAEPPTPGSTVTFSIRKAAAVPADFSG